MSYGAVNLGESRKDRNRTNGHAMFMNATPNRSKTDRRVRRTRDALGNALIELMQEKPFDTITVQDVLNRAGVGRSTFYVHYSDKEDLFMSEVDEFFASLSMHLSLSHDASDRVVLLREFCAHLTEARRFLDALTASGKFRGHLELARGHFARGIERRLSELPQSHRIPAEKRAAISHASAGALLSLLQWWIDRGMCESPTQLDDLFHQMFWGGVDSACASSGAR